MSVAGKLLKQKGLPTWVGGLQIQMQSSMMYVTIYNYIMITVTFWVTAGPLVKGYIPWITLPIFVAIAITFFFCVIIPLDYKFVLPARIAFQVRQSYKHKNPAVADLQEIKRQNTELLKQNKEIKSDLSLIKQRIGMENE